MDNRGVSGRPRFLGLAPAARVHHIHNGVPVPEQPPARGPWPAEPVPVTATRLAPGKDVTLLLDALAQSELSAWRLRVIGDSPVRQSFLAQRDALGLSGRVEILGQRTDVPEQLARADAFDGETGMLVPPGRSAYELADALRRLGADGNAACALWYRR